MKKKIPSKTVDVCDICHRESASSLLEKCVVCGREYCFSCEAIIMGCIHKVQACKQCGNTDAVKSVVERFVQPLRDILKKRDAALRWQHGQSAFVNAALQSAERRIDAALSSSETPQGEGQKGEK